MRNGTNKLSTYINELIKAGFTIERIVEDEPSSDFDEQAPEPSTKYYSLHKSRILPIKLIVKERK